MMIDINQLLTGLSLIVALIFLKVYQIDSSKWRI